MIPIVLFQLLILLWLRRFLTRNLIRLVLYLGGNLQAAYWIYSIISLPGVALHEISHFFTAAFLGFRTGKIDLLPKFMEDGGVELGSVQVASSDPVRHSLVGIAPFVSGGIVIGLISSKLDAEFATISDIFSVFINISSEPLKLFGIYLISVISLHLFPSRKDLATWPVILLIFALFALIVSRFSPGFQFLFQDLMLGFCFAIIINLGLSILLTLINIVISRFIRKRIITLSPFFE